MSNDLKNEYIRILWLRYQNSNRKQKVVVLNEFCAVSGFTRKYAIKLFNRVPEHWFKKRPGRERINSEQAIYHLRKLWLLSKQMNSKRLRDALPD